MRILVLTQWYPPEPQKLLGDLTEAMRMLGHDVEVLTGFPNYPSGELAPGYRIRLWQRENLAGISVLRVPLYPDHSRSSMKRVINYASFAIAAAVVGPWLIRRPDVIFVIHPPLTVGLPAWVLSKLYRVPYVLNVQDLWPETLAATGMLSNLHVLALVGRVAQWVYAAATKVIVISEGFRTNLISKGVPPEKLEVIANWVDIEHYRPVEPDGNLAASYGLQDRFNVMFAGVVGRAQGLDTILKAAILLRDLPEIQFVIVGDGVDLAELMAMADKTEATNVRFLGRHPADVMPELFSLADVLLVHLKDTPVFRITIPHKIGSYLSSGKPVLAAVAGDAATVISSVDAGLVCAPDNPQAMADTVRKFFAMSYADRQAMGERGRKAAIDKLSQQRQVAKIANVLRTTLHKE